MGGCSIRPIGFFQARKMKSIWDHERISGLNTALNRLSMTIKSPKQRLFSSPMGF